MRVVRAVWSAAFFLMFGIGGVLFSLLLAFPLSKPSARRILRFLFRFFVRAGEAVGLFNVAVSDADRSALRSVTGSVVVSNHRTLIDAVILLSLLGDSVCVTKEGVSRNPFMRTVAKKILVVNDGSVSVMRTATRYLEEGVNVVVFPEGTRVPADAPEHVFHSGAARIAIRAGSPVETVFMDCDLAILAKGQPWWDVGSRTAKYGVVRKGRIEISPQDGVSRKTAAEELTARMHGKVFGS